MTFNAIHTGIHIWAYKNNIGQHDIYNFIICNNVQKQFVKKTSKNVLWNLNLTKIDDNILCLMINNHNLLMGTTQDHVARLHKCKVLFWLQQKEEYGKRLSKSYWYNCMLLLYWLVLFAHCFLIPVAHNGGVSASYRMINKSNIYTNLYKR